jgi:LysR family transcriptional regulator of gallate degradation
MDESLGRLRALLAVAEHNNVVQAARQLNLSQPAVTKAVRTMENNLGVKLFDRTSRGMMPTIFGRTLIRRAKLIFAELHKADMELGALRGLETGNVVVGTSPIGRSLLLPEGICRLVEESPGLQVTVLEGVFEKLIGWLRNGDLEFIVGTIWEGSADDGLATEVMTDDQVAIVARQDHPLAQKKTLEYQDFEDVDWVLPGRDSPQRQQFEKKFEQQGIHIKQNIISMNSLSTIREILVNTDRLTILSPPRVKTEVAANILTILPFDLPETKRPIGVTRRQTDTLSPAAEMLLNHLRDAAKVYNGASI